jgi:selenocysteine lyase/cysteine desulfurase
MVYITVGSAANPILEFLEEWGTENFERYHRPSFRRLLRFLSMVAGLEFIGMLTCW